MKLNESQLRKLVKGMLKESIGGLQHGQFITTPADFAALAATDSRVDDIEIYVLDSRGEEIYGPGIVESVEQLPDGRWRVDIYSADTFVWIDGNLWLGDPDYDGELEEENTRLQIFIESYY